MSICFRSLFPAVIAWGVFLPGSFAGKTTVTLPGIVRSADVHEVRDFSNNDKRLQRPVTVSSVGRPVSEILSVLSTSSLQFRAATVAVSEQRVTVVAEDAPLYVVLNDLRRLLDHGEANDGHVWLGDGPNERDELYLLSKTSRARAAEQAALDAPRKRGGELLRAVRELATASETDQERLKSGVPQDFLGPDAQIFRQGLAGLADDQFGELTRSGYAPAPANVLGERIASYNAKWRSRSEEARSAILRAGGKDPFPNGVPEKPVAAPTVRFAPNDEEGTQPTQGNAFALSLDGVDLLPPGQFGEVRLVLNPASLEPRDKRETVVPEPEPGRVYDLSPVLDAPGVTDAQRADLAFVLSALARVTGVRVYEEHFYKVGFRGARIPPFPLRKGTLNELVAKICGTWRYRVHSPRPGTLLFWSETWALDRSFDVSEKALQPWRKRLAATPKLGALDRARLATQVTFPQAFQTITGAFPQAAVGQWNALQYVTLRAVGMMSDPEQQAALNGGVAFSALSATAQAAIFERERFAATGSMRQELPPAGAARLRERLSQSVVRLTLLDDGDVLLSVEPPQSKQVGQAESG